MSSLRTIQIKKMALGGDGLGHSGSKAVFVPYSLPGEEVAGNPVKDKKNFGRWIPHKISSHSSDRQSPACPYHFQTKLKSPPCGGCQWQHIQIDRQRKIKTELLVEAIQHMGGINDFSVHPIIKGENDFRYRNKVQIPFSVRKGSLVAGFYAPESHDVVEFDDCLTQSEFSVKIFKFIKQIAKINKWRPYQKDLNRGWLRHLLVRTNQKNQALLVLVTKNDAFPQKNEFVKLLQDEFPAVVGLFQNVQPARTNVILGRKWKHLWGQKRLSETIAGMDVEFGPGTFMQINTDVAEKMYIKAIELLQLKSETIVYDFYSGLGMMSFLAAPKAKQVYAVESVPDAVRDGEWNQKKMGIRNVKFFPLEAEKFIQKSEFRSARSQDEVVILDPPRSGCEKKVIEAINKKQPHRIVYISCNPATLARDLKELNKNYKVKEVVPIDLFPHTAHIESITYLERKV